MLFCVLVHPSIATRSRVSDFRGRVFGLCIATKPGRKWERTYLTLDLHSGAVLNGDPQVV